MTKKRDEDASHDVTPVARPAAIALPPSDLKPMELHAKEKSTPAWLFAAMKACHQFGEGKELTANEYDAAIDRAANLKMIPG